MSPRSHQAWPPRHCSKTPFGFNIGLGQTETVAHGNITPTFGVHDIDAAIAALREQDVTVEDWHEIPGMVRLRFAQNERVSLPGSGRDVESVHGRSFESERLGFQWPALVQA